MTAPFISARILGRQLGRAVPPHVSMVEAAGQAGAKTGQRIRKDSRAHRTSGRAVMEFDKRRLAAVLGLKD
jgi:hypothetical protein